MFPRQKSMAVPAAFLYIYLSPPQVNRFGPGRINVRSSMDLSPIRVRSPVYIVFMKLARFASPSLRWCATPLLYIALIGRISAAVPLSWLDGTPPAVPSGVASGVPWPRGSVPGNSQFSVHTASGQAVPTQTWPLAYWPDGSLKWSGVAISADATLTGPLTIDVGSGPAPAQPVRVEEDAASITVSTGVLRCKISRTGENLIDSLSIEGREVGRSGRLQVVREDRSLYETQGIRRDELYTSRVTKVTVEQAGPVRAVIRVEGMHAKADPARSWLPFTVRLYFSAGLTSVRMVHSFIYDGDAGTDYIRGMGLVFGVPFREEKQNRHIRLAGDGDGVWGEPVLMSPGYREVLVAHAVQMNRDQLIGKRIPNLKELGDKGKHQFESVALWDAFKLTQLAPDSFSIDKRTGTASSWLHVANGHRANGLIYLGDVSGGLAVGVKRFWEKYPASLEIAGAASEVGEMRVWFWSPDAPAMDLRHYDTVGHEPTISYEDHQEGFSTPYGVANTTELTLWALPNTPENSALNALAKISREPPLLVCTPEYYHSTHTLGAWSLPDRSTPDKAELEDTLDRAWQFYHGEVERRRWYGFWDYGDFMRTYDRIRHEWEYDIGGHAWNNTELLPNLWLWFTFLRTGHADAFRFAEAMTRNTSEVDVYHAGRFFGLGSRHNVSHWGDGAKESRISEALLKRFYYYLTTDERTGDLMREVLTVDETVARIQPLREELVRPDVPIIIRIGPDWEAMASNWMTEWERTGNVRYRDYVLAGMKSIGAMPDALIERNGFRYDPVTKRLFDIGQPNQKAGEFLALFGGDQIAMDLIDLIDCPEFAAAWNGLADKWARAVPGPGYTKIRFSAYAASVEHDPALGAQAWELMRKRLYSPRTGERLPTKLVSITDSSVPEPVEENPNGVDTPGTSQLAISIIMATEMAHSYYTPPSASGANTGSPPATTPGPRPTTTPSPKTR